jgi:hypothetical protein
MAWQATTQGKRPPNKTLIDVGRKDTSDFEGKGN